MGAAYDVVYYIKLFLFIAGSCGNLFTIGIWKTKVFRARPRSIICSILAVANTLFLLLTFTQSTRWHFSYTPILSSSNFSCQLKSVLYGLTQHVDSWLISFLSVERFFAVFNPNLAKKMFNRTKAAICVAFITVIFSIFNVGVALSSVSVSNIYQSYNKCNIERTLGFKIRQFLIDVIPLLIITPCNVVIVIKVISGYWDIRHSIQLTQQQLAKKKFIKASILTLSITLSFIVLIVPNNVYLLCCRNPNDPRTIFVLSLLPMVNASINGYMFALASKQFRKKVKSELVRIVTGVFTCPTTGCMHNDVGPMQ